MTDVVGYSAHEVVDKTLDYVLEHGDEKTVWGGTIPDEEGEKDFDREMVEVIDGFSLRLDNPRKRWTEIGNNWMHTLREMEDDLYQLNPGMVHHYLPLYESWQEDGEYPHTYGRRMRSYGADSDRGKLYSIDQWDSVVQMLKENPNTRKACFTFWNPACDSAQILTDNAYVPCNVFFQVTIRDGKLIWKTHSRSKDALRGLTQNIFEFSLLQEIMANQLDVDVGPYIETSTNIHIYQEQIDDGYIDHGFRDPYDVFDVDKTPDPTDPWDDTTKNILEKIDSHLLDRHYTGAVNLLHGMKRGYWRSWKAALVAEYIRIEDDDKEKADLCFDACKQMEHPWLISVAKRMCRDYEDNVFVDIVPNCFKEEVENWS